MGSFENLAADQKHFGVLQAPSGPRLGRQAHPNKGGLNHGSPKRKGPAVCFGGPFGRVFAWPTDPFEIITHREAKQSPPLQAVLDDLTQDFEAERHGLTVEASWRHAAVLLI